MIFQSRYRFAESLKPPDGSGLLDARRERDKLCFPAVVRWTFAVGRQHERHGLSAGPCDCAWSVASGRNYDVHSRASNKSLTVPTAHFVSSIRGSHKFAPAKSSDKELNRFKRDLIHHVRGVPHRVGQKRGEAQESVAPHKGTACLVPLPTVRRATVRELAKNWPSTISRFFVGAAIQDPKCLGVRKVRTGARTRS